MKNKFYTIMIIPEKSAKIRKIRVPHYIVNFFFLSVGILSFFLIMMLFDYWYAMTQVSESIDLKNENRKLRHRVQMVENKLFVIENVIKRMKSFSTRLKLIMQQSPKNFLVFYQNQTMSLLQLSFKINQAKKTAFGKKEYRKVFLKKL